jgi:WD40 repeat protein
VILKTRSRCQVIAFTQVFLLLVLVVQSIFSYPGFLTKSSYNRTRVSFTTALGVSSPVVTINVQQLTKLSKVPVLSRIRSIAVSTNFKEFKTYAVPIKPTYKVSTFSSPCGHFLAVMQSSFVELMVDPGKDGSADTKRLWTGRGEPASVAFRPSSFDKTTGAYGQCEEVAVALGKESNAIQVFRLCGDFSAKYEIPVREATALAYSPDGDYLAYGTDSGEVKVINLSKFHTSGLAKCVELSVFLPDRGVTSVVFGHKGSSTAKYWMFAISHTGKVYQMLLTTSDFHKKPFLISNPKERCMAIDASLVEPLVVFGTLDGSITLADYEDVQDIVYRRMADAKVGALTNVQFVNESQFVVSGENSAKLWNFQRTAKIVGKGIQSGESTLSAPEFALNIDAPPCTTITGCHVTTDGENQELLAVALPW